MSPIKAAAGGVRAVLADPRLRTVLAFTLACAVGSGYLWVKSGGEIPVIASRSGDYRVSFEADDIKNLKDFGEVRIAGVRVGRVEATERDGEKVTVTLSIEDQAAPLHQGANARVGVKSLVGSSFVELVDGKGADLPDGSHLSGTSVTPAVDVDELLDTLDEPTRQHLGSALQGLDRATGERGSDIDALMSGLGGTGREGRPVIDALAAQSKDLQQLTVETRVLLDALDTGEGQIVSLVGDSQRLTQVTAANQKEIEESVRQLPALVGNLETAAASLSELEGSLAPIAADLRTAAPFLSSALTNLRPAARDLRALVPDLDGVIDAAPATLNKVEPFDETVQNVIPEAQATLADVQPMLGYLAPYGRDLGVLFGSFGASFDQYAEDGVIPVRLTATAEGAGTVRGNPVPLVSREEGGLLWNNPYPLPGDVDNPRPFGAGDYPRVKRAP